MLSCIHEVIIKVPSMQLHLFTLFQYVHIPSFYFLFARLFQEYFIWHILLQLFVDLVHLINIQLCVQESLQLLRIYELLFFEDRILFEIFYLLTYQVAVGSLILEALDQQTKLVDIYIEVFFLQLFDEVLHHRLCISKIVQCSLEGLLVHSVQGQATLKLELAGWMGLQYWQEFYQQLSKCCDTLLFVGLCQF